MMVRLKGDEMLQAIKRTQTGVIIHISFVYHDSNSEKKRNEHGRLSDLKQSTKMLSDEDWNDDKSEFMAGIPTQITLPRNTSLIPLRPIYLFLTFSHRQEPIRPIFQILSFPASFSYNFYSMTLKRNQKRRDDVLDQDLGGWD